MKKSLLYVAAIFASSAFAQQTPVSQTAGTRVAILEELTGINCQYCPDGHKRANEIDAANPEKVVLVNIHAGGFAAATPDYRTTDGNALDVFLNAAGYPAGSVQRIPLAADPAEIAVSRSEWVSQVNSTIIQTAEANIAMNATIDAATRELILNVEIFYTTPQAPGTNHFLNIGILQDDLESSQSGAATWYPAQIQPNGLYQHKHMFRGFLNAGGTFGESIDASTTTVITKNVTYTLPASIGGIPLNLGKLEFFAMLSKGNIAPTAGNLTAASVINAAEITPEYTNVPNATASASSILNTLLTCSGSSIVPVVKVSNSGTQINSLEFSYAVSGGVASTYTWNGVIPVFGTQEIALPAIVANQSTVNNCVVTITSVNGGAGSIGTAVSTKPVTYASNTANLAQGTVKVIADRYGSETTWKLLNSAGTVVAQGGPYSDATANGSYPQADVNFTITPNDCYKLEVNDAYGDGFDGTYGDGSVNVLSGTTTVCGVTAFTTSQKFDAMKSSTTLSIAENNSIIASVYPNPANDFVNVNFEGNGGKYLIQITDLSGRVLNSTELNKVNGSQTATLATDILASGNYLVVISTEGLESTLNVIVK